MYSCAISIPVSPRNRKRRESIHLEGSVDLLDLIVIDVQLDQTVDFVGSIGNDFDRSVLSDMRNGNAVLINSLGIHVLRQNFLRQRQLDRNRFDWLNSVALTIDKTNIEREHAVELVSLCFQSFLGLAVGIGPLIEPLDLECYRLCKGAFRHVNNNEDAVELSLVMCGDLYFFLFQEFFFQELLFCKFLFGQSL